MDKTIESSKVKSCMMHDYIRSIPKGVENRLSRFNCRHGRTKQWLIISNQYNRLLTRLH